MDFKCDYNNHNFSTPSYEEWLKHKAELEHEHTGSTSCRDCGQINIPLKVVMSLQPNIAPPAYCEDCKERLRKMLNE